MTKRTKRILRPQQLERAEKHNDKFKIQDVVEQSPFRIRSNFQGIKVNKKIRYGKRKTKEQALEEIQAVRAELMKDHFNIVLEPKTQPPASS